jgi:stage V sporulation protein R
MPNDVEDLREHYDLCMNKAHEWGLTPFEVDFHIVPADKMYEIASYGVPGHFSHWTYGRNFWKQKTSYDYGHSKIYELVIINSNPAQAFPPGY